MSQVLRRVEPEELDTRRGVIEGEVAAAAADIVEDVRTGGLAALREHSERLGDTQPGEELVWGRDRLEEEFDSLDGATRDLIGRVHDRIRRFARAQREGLGDLTTSVDGGRAGHRWVPVGSVGAYAPGGRYPLPSSVLMTVTPARVAGVTSVWLASPRPTALTAAAAWLAGADGMLAVGGAQAVAALAFGTVTPAVDMIVGPGNKWVTAAKKHLYGEVGLDGLAGPSEILVVADGTADIVLVAADLLAQAEHDVDALPLLITNSEELADEVDAELARQLRDLPSAEVARAALGNGRVLVVADVAEARRIADSIAPEHLALHVEDPGSLEKSLSNYGSIFIGAEAGETFADYGAGPNHVLPTAGGCRFSAGLSVFTFLRAMTWLSIDDPHQLIEDTTRMARLEGLEAHARAALARS
jgi:histidinol dehydrogenase